MDLSEIIVSAQSLTAIILGPLGKAQAYLDPGSGSFIIQLVIGVLLGGAVAMRAYWSKIKDFFSRNKTEDSQAEQNDDTPVA